MPMPNSKTCTSTAPAPGAKRARSANPKEKIDKMKRVVGINKVKKAERINLYEAEDTDMIQIRSRRSSLSSNVILE